MTQKLFGLGLGGTGIVGVLIVAGLLLKITGISTGLGDLSLFAGIAIAIVYGLLGAVSIASRLAGS